jgi:putative ABC transport system permease protein
MILGDIIKLTISSLRAHRLRSALTALGIGIGIAAVVLLTSIGEGVQRYVLSEFTQFGTHLMMVSPGKTKTAGISGAVLGTVKPLSIEDSESLRSVEHVIGIVPVIQGNAEVEFGRRGRRTTVIGAGHDAPLVWKLNAAVGRFLPADDAGAARAFVVLGPKVKQELFGANSPLGSRVRVGAESFRVIGVMESKGQFLGFDLDDAVYIPTSRALETFNREGLMEVDVLYAEHADVERLQARIKERLIARHGREDFTIVTQEQMLDVLGYVLEVLTFAVAALGGISLLVGGIGILTIMIIAVNERTSEVGLLRALGAKQGQVLALFLGEAVTLSALGGSLGLAVGFGITQLLKLLVPALPVQLTWPFVLFALTLATLVGVVAGIMPARRAAALDPVEALRAE